MADLSRYPDSNGNTGDNTGVGRLQHPRRWQYLAVALALAVLVGFFLVNDAPVLYV